MLHLLFIISKDLVNWKKLNRNAKMRETCLAHIQMIKLSEQKSCLCIKKKQCAGFSLTCFWWHLLWYKNQTGKMGYDGRFFFLQFPKGNARKMLCLWNVKGKKWSKNENKKRSTFEKAKNSFCFKPENILIFFFWQQHLRNLQRI